MTNPSDLILNEPDRQPWEQRAKAARRWLTVENNVENHSVSSGIRGKSDGRANIFRRGFSPLCEIASYPSFRRAL